MTSTSKRRGRNNKDSFLSQSSGSSDNDEDLPDIPTRTRHAANNNDTIDRRAARNVAVFNAELIEGLLDGLPATQEIEARERADALKALQEQRAKKRKGKEKETPGEEEASASASASGSSAKRRKVIIESEDEGEEQDELQDDQDEDEEVASNLLNATPSASQSRASTSSVTRNALSAEARFNFINLGGEYANFTDFVNAAQESLSGLPPDGSTRGTRIQGQAGSEDIHIECIAVPSCDAHVSAKPIDECRWQVFDKQLIHVHACPNKPKKPTQTPSNGPGPSRGFQSSVAPFIQSAAPSQQASRSSQTSSTLKADQNRQDHNGHHRSAMLTSGRRSAPEAQPAAHTDRESQPSASSYLQASTSRQGPRSAEAMTSQARGAPSSNGQPTSWEVLRSTIMHVRSNSRPELSQPIKIGWTFTSSEGFARAAVENLTSLPEQEGMKLVERRNTSQNERLVYDLIKCFMATCHAHVLAAHPSENVWRIARLDLQHHTSCPVRPSVPHPLAPLPGPSSDVASSDAQTTQPLQTSQPISRSSSATQHGAASSADSALQAPDATIGAVYFDYDQFSSAAIQSLTHLPARQAAADRVEEIKVAQAGTYDAASFRCKGLSCGAEIKATHFRRDIWQVSLAILIHSTLCPYQPNGAVNKLETPPIQANSASSANASSSHLNGSISASATVPSSVSPAMESRPVPQQDGNIDAPLPNGPAPARALETSTSAGLNSDTSVKSGTAPQADRAEEANGPTASTSATRLVNGDVSPHINGSSTIDMDVITADAIQAKSCRRKGKRRASQQDMDEELDESVFRVGRSYNSLPQCRTAAFQALGRKADDIDTIRRMVDDVNTVIYKCMSEGCTAFVEADLPGNDWTVKAVNLEHISSCSAAHSETANDQANAALPLSQSTATQQATEDPPTNRRPIGSPRTGRKTTRPAKRRRTASPLAEPANGQHEERRTGEALPTGTRFDSYDELLAASASALSRDPADLVMTSGDVPPNSKWIKLVCKNHNPPSRPFRRGMVNLMERSGRSPQQSRCQARVSAEVDPATKEHIVVRARYEHSIECNQAEFEAEPTNGVGEDADEDLARAIAASQALAEEKANEAAIQAVRAMERREERAKRKDSFSPMAEDAMQATALALSDVFDSAASVRAALIGALGRPEEELVVQFEYASTTMPQYGRMLVRCKRCSLILPRSNVDVTNLVDEPKEVLPGPRCNAVVNAEEHYGDWKVVFIQLAHSEACQDVNRLQQAPFSSNRWKSGTPASSLSMQIDTHVEAVQEGGEGETGVSAIEPAAGPSTLVPHSVLLASPSRTVETPPLPFIVDQQTLPSANGAVRPSQQKRLAKVIEISDSDDEQEAQPTSAAMTPRVKEEPKSPGRTPTEALPSATTTSKQLASDPLANTLQTARPIAYANQAATQALEALEQSSSPSAVNAPSSANSSAVVPPACSASTSQSDVFSRPPLRIPDAASERQLSTEDSSNDQVPSRVCPPAFGESLPDIATFRRRVEEHSQSIHAGRALLWNERMHRLSCPTEDCPYAFGSQINAGGVGVILARSRHSEACMRLEQPPIAAATDSSTDTRATSDPGVTTSQSVSASPPEGSNVAEAALPDVTVKPEEVVAIMDDAAPEPDPPVEYDPVHHNQHEEDGLVDDFVETSTPSRGETSTAMKRSGKSSRSRSLNRHTVTPSTSTTTSRGGRGKCRYADPPSPSPSASDIPKARSQYRPDGTPRVPRSGYRYESEQDLEARIRAYSKYLNPAAKLRKENKRKNTLSLVCTHADCNFHFFAENERRKEDGVVAQGMLILESQPRHSQTCTDTEAQASSPLVTPRFKAVARLGGRASTVSVRSTPGNSDAESAGDLSRNARKRPSLGRQERAKRRRTLGANGSSSQQGELSYHSGHDKSATPVEIKQSGSVERDLVESPTNPSEMPQRSSAQEAEAPAAREPQSGETLASTQEFEDLVSRHNRYVNPESKYSISVSQDGRVSIKCTNTKKQCTYGFVGKKLGFKADSPVLVKSTNPSHSVACEQYYKHKGYRYAPKVGERVESWEHFQEMVEQHSEMLNPEAVLEKEIKVDRQKIFCNGDDEVRCSYQFNARYYPRGENVGTIEITVSQFIHSDDCREHYGNLARPGNRSSGSRADAAADNAADEETAEPGTIIGTLYEDEDDFKNVVTEHSQLKAPGAALVWKRTKKYIEGQCKYHYAGCRYEFHAAKYIDEKEQKEKLVLTDVKRSHNKDCERERMLMLAGAGMVKGDSSEGSRRPQRSNVKRNSSSLAHLSASGASDSSWQENDTVDITMMDASAMDAPGPLATSTPISRPALVAPTMPRPPGPSPNMASPALTPPVADTSAATTAPAASVIESSRPAEVEARPMIDENLETIYLPHGVLPILQQFHYSKVSDLSEAGVTNADWPQLLQHLEELASFSYLEEEGENVLKADPVTGFIFEKRAAAALSVEYINRYHAQTRMPEPDGPLQL